MKPKKIGLFSLSLVAIFFYTGCLKKDDYGSSFIYKKIDENKIFYCLSEVTTEYTKIAFAFDAYRSRVYHMPLGDYNTVKLIKSEVFDEPSSAFTETYHEYSGTTKVAEFTLIRSGDELWEATYTPFDTKKTVRLDDEIFNLNAINAVCTSAVNLFQD